MRRVILGAVMTAMLTAGQPVLAQSNQFRPVVYINDSVVTEFDIQQRIRFLQLLRAPNADRAGAETAMIEDRLRIQAAKALEIEPSQEAITAAVAEFASRGGLSPEQFEQLLRQNGIDPQNYLDFIVAGVAWRDVVRARIVPNIRVSDAEIRQEFDKVVQTPRVTDVLLSEMIIPAPEGQEGQTQALAEDLAGRIRNEGQFAAAAREYSATQSRDEGGRLPWTPLANLPPSLQPIIMSMQPGQVSQPLTVQGAVVLFMLRDTRGVVQAGARDQVLEYLHLRLNNPSEATRIKAGLRNCADLFQQASALPAEYLIHKTENLGTIPATTALALASLDADEVTISGGDIIMLCKRIPALLAAAETQPAVPVTEGEPVGQDQNSGIPDEDQIRDMIFNRKINNAADAHLAELRADAVIRR